MTIETINLGSTANDGTGDPLRVAFQKINNNFAELNSSGSSSSVSGPDWSVQFREGNDLTGVAFLGSLYVAVGKPNRVLTSSNAGTWSFNETPTTNDLNAIISNGTTLIAVGALGEIQTTTDAVTWATQTSTTTNALLAVAYNGSTTAPEYVAVGEAGTIITSTDAVTWVTRTSTTTNTLRSVVWSALNSSWVAVGDTGTILVSANGITWAAQTSGTTASLYSVATNGSILLVVGTLGTILNSADAITWATGTSGVTADLTALAFYDIVTTTGTTTTAFVVGSDGTIISSTDFGTWETTTYPSPSSNDLYSVTVANNILIAVGHNGTIVQLIDGELALDSVSAGSSGSSKFLFNDQANLLSIAANIVPQTDETWSLGANGNAWANIWVSGNSALHIGDVSVLSNTTTALDANSNVYITGTTITLHETGNANNLSNLTVKHVDAESIEVTGNVEFVNITITGTATIANLVAANANLTTLVAETITANGVVSANGNLAVAGELTANTANIAYTLVANGDITSNANVNANFFIGNGAYLTGIVKKADGVNGSVQFADANLDFAGDSNFYYDSTTFTVYSDNFVGNVAGNVTGNITGDLTGNVTGNITGNVTGNITGTTASFDDVTVANLLTSPLAQITVVQADTITAVTSITAANVNAVDVSAATANIATLVAPALTSTTATITDVTSTNANVTTVRTTTLNAITGSVENLTTITGSITTLTSNAITANTVTSNITTTGVVNANTVVASVSVTSPTFTGNLSGNVVAQYIDVTGNVTAGNLIGNYGIYGNLTGNVNAEVITSNAITANYSTLGVATASTVTANTLTGNIVSANANIVALTAGNIIANNGSFTANVQAVNVTASTFRGNLVGNVNGNVIGNLTAVNISVSGNANIDKINGDTATFTGDIQAQNVQFLTANVSTLYASSNIETLGNVTANNIVATLITGTLTTATQANITSVGTLDNLRVNGNSNANHVYANAITINGNIDAQNMTLAGNLSVAGNITYTNVNQVTVESPLIDLGGGPNSSQLTANDGFDRGIIQHYFTTSAQNAYMGWKNDQQEYVFAARSTVSNNVVTITALGNILAGDATLDNITASNVTLTGNLNLNDITSNRVFANYLLGDGSNITGLTVMGLTAGPNISLINNSGNWTISASLPTVAGNIEHAVQFALADGNLTSSSNLLFYSANNTMVLVGNAYANDFYGNMRGTLYGNVDGNTATFTGAVTALSFSGDFNGNLTGNVSGNIQGVSGNFSSNLNAGTLAVTGNATVGNIAANVGAFTTISGSLTTPDQSNITKIGSLSSLIVTGNATVGNLTGANLISANYLTGTLTTASQPNITAVGTLTGLTVNGNISARDITSNTSIVAPTFQGNLNGNVTGNVIGNIAGNITGATGNFTAAVTVGTTLDVVGNITAGNIDGGNIVRANYFTGVITTNAQPNITSVGSLSNLIVTGNASIGNISGANLISANYVNGTLTTPAQPNITSVGILTSLDVLGNITAANVQGGNTVAANFLTGTITTPAQPNITSVGTLTSLDVTGAVSIGNTLSGNGATFTANVSANNLTVTNTTTTANIIANVNANLGNIRIEGSNITEIGTADFLIKSSAANMIISTPNSLVNGANGKTLTLTTGYASGNARGGDLNLTTGESNSANAGTINILSGNGQSTGTLGGNINIIAGSTIGSPDTINGANIYIQSGHTINEDGGALIMKGGDATGSFLFGGNIYLTPGLGDSANNQNYDGRVIIGKSAHLWPNDVGNANAILQTDGTGRLVWANGDSLGGGLRNVEANGTSLFADITTSGNIKFSAGNVSLITGPIQTVGITGVKAANANAFGVVEFRVTPTGIPVDSPFTANFDMSSTGDNLQDDFSSFSNEAGTKWLWDLSETPKAGLLRHDLGVLA